VLFRSGPTDNRGNLWSGVKKLTNADLPGGSKNRCCRRSSFSKQLMTLPVFPGPNLEDGKLDVGQFWFLGLEFVAQTVNGVDELKPAVLALYLFPQLVYVNVDRSFRPPKASEAFSLD